MNFQSDQHLYALLQALFEQLKKVPEQIHTFTHSNLVVRARFTEPEAEILFDGRQPPLEIFYGPRPGKANLEISLPATLLDEIWSDEAQMTQAFFDGRIQTKGNLMKAAPFIDLFRACNPLYADIKSKVVVPKV